MQTNIPVKDLSRFNWMFTTVIGLFLYLCVFIGIMEHREAISSAIMAAAAVMIISFCNLYLRINLEEKAEHKGYPVWFWICSYLAAVCIYFILWPFCSYIANGSWSYGSWTVISAFLVANCVVNTMVIIMHNFIILQHDKRHADLENSQLKAANAEAAYQLLKQQIQPHFLFNTLTTLKSLYRKSPQQGEGYLMHLADFLRAAISNNRHKISSLQDELIISLNYLDMQKIRFGEALLWDINIQGGAGGYVPAFSVQPLIENAIKHNELTNENPLLISIYSKDGRIQVCNKIRLKHHKEPSTGQGLANLAERYRIWSGDEVLIKEEDGFFSVTIKILTHEDSNH